MRIPETPAEKGPQLIAEGLMAKLPPGPAKAFVGRWRIVEMDVWDKDFLNLVETAHLTFKDAADGEIAFGALKGFLDVRDGTRDGSACAEFSWEGNDEKYPGLRSWMGCPWHNRPPRRTLLNPQRRRFRLRMRSRLTSSTAC